MSTHVFNKKARTRQQAICGKLISCFTTPSLLISNTLNTKAFDLRTGTLAFALKITSKMTPLFVFNRTE